MLSLENIKAGYGKKRIINDLSMKVDSNKICALIGHNGAGKSTILKTIIGTLPLWSGTIQYNGRVLTSNPKNNIDYGISYLAQGAMVFRNLAVKDNLRIASFVHGESELQFQCIENIYKNFSILHDKKNYLARHLSGGEQQILAIGMALVQQPKLLLMDEPSLGLSRRNIDKVFDLIVSLNQENDIAFLIVEQKVERVLEISDYTYVLRLGEIALEDNSKTLLREKSYKRIFMS